VVSSEQFSHQKILVARAEEDRFVKNKSSEASCVAQRQFKAAVAVACVLQ
jgi:hypothetical protein